MAIQDNDIMEIGARLEYETGEDIMNVYQLRKDTSGPITDQEGIDDVIRVLDLLYRILNIFIPLLTTYRDLSIRNVTQDIVYGSFPWETLVNGEAAGNAVAPGVSGVGTFQTLVPNVMLRKYWGPYTDIHQTLDGRLAPGMVAAMASAQALMLSPMPGLLTFWDYGYLSPKTLTYVLPSAALVTNIPGYQRRRKQGRGS